MDSMWLCCSSNTETVHIFKLEEPKETYASRIRYFFFFFQLIFHGKNVGTNMLLILQAKQTNCRRSTKLDGIFDEGCDSVGYILAVASD